MNYPRWQWIVGAVIFALVVYTVIRDIRREKRGACVRCGEAHADSVSCRAAKLVRELRPLCPRCLGPVARDASGEQSCQRCRLWL